MTAAAQAFGHPVVRGLQPGNPSQRGHRVNPRHGLLERVRAVRMHRLAADLLRTIVDPEELEDRLQRRNRVFDEPLERQEQQRFLGVILEITLNLNRVIARVGDHRIKLQVLLERHAVRLPSEHFPLMAMHEMRITPPNGLAQQVDEPGVRIDPRDRFRDVRNHRPHRIVRRRLSARLVRPRASKRPW